MSEKFTHADERLGLDSPHVRAAKGIYWYAQSIERHTLRRK
jgi:hypothetical protein